MKQKTTNTNEINQFSKDSHFWWDENGPFAPLHRVNPARLSFIRDTVQTEIGNSLKDLKILDVGCGGGLVCEPLARMGADVTGLDADANGIAVATAHAAPQNLPIKYHNSSIEDFRTAHPATVFDVITALEIIEHVDAPDLFLAECATCLKPSGLIFISTLNKTPKSWALGIVAAEYILNLVPRGTHTWQKFVKPSRVAEMLKPHGCRPVVISGLVYNPITKTACLSKTDMDVNYIMAFRKDFA